MRERALLVTYLLFVIYGSLVPLEFVPIPFDEAWRRFGQIPFLALGVDSRADWVANGVLYFPLAVLSARVVHRAIRAVPLAGSLLALGACLCVAVGVEFTQLFFPARTVSLNDLMAEGLGSLAGVLVTPILSPWIQAIGRARLAGGLHFGRHMLLAYAAGYVVLAFFPYDLLLNGAELQAKIDSSAWGWLFARPGRGWTMAGFQLGVEVALAVPLGLWLSRHLRSLGVVVTAGMLLGLGIELGQFLIATGVTQGASVLARMAGVAAGAIWAPKIVAVGLGGLRDRLTANTWPIAAAYLLALAFVNGWFRGAWHGFPQAATAWADLHWMPFYYHYFTTEALALYSLGSVSLMYLPLAALGWARRAGRAVNLSVIGVVAAVIEVSKLFIDGTHPDPTNVLIAVIACGVALEWLATVQRQAAAGQSNPAIDAPRGAVTTAPSGPTARWPVLVVVPASLAWAWTLPAVAGWVIPVLLASAALVWWRPVAALAIILAGIPGLDLAPWTGRFFFGEFDLLVLTCAAVAIYRTPASAPHAEGSRWRTGVFAMFGLSLGLSTLHMLAQWQGFDANSFSSYYSPFNALRIAKGAAWAWLLVVLYRRVGHHREQWAQGGMLAGLAIAIGWVIWERVAFVGVLDFHTDYRVTGPFSAMHRGGAFIECYLVVGAAFAIGWALRARSWWQRTPALALVVGASYAVMVTYSRNGQGALLLVGLLSVVAFVIGRPPTELRKSFALALPLVLVGAVACLVLLGPYARDRLAHSAADLGVRHAHWADALAMRSHSPWAQVFGEGLGAYPVAHFWRSREPVHAASYSLVRHDKNTWLRLGAGATLYLDQVVARPTGRQVQVEAVLRSATTGAEVHVSLCEKWMLTSATCAAAVLKLPAAGSAWQRIATRMDVTAVHAGQPFNGRPLKFAVATPGGRGSVELDNLRLVDDGDTEMLSNGNFSAGMDHWFFSTDVDPPWHVHSMPVAVLFEGGWFAVVVWAILLTMTVVQGFRASRSGHALPANAWVAAAGFLVCASVNTLIDDPKFLALLMVMLWLASSCVGCSVAAKPVPRPHDDVPAVDCAPGETSRRGA